MFYWWRLITTFYELRYFYNDNLTFTKDTLVFEMCSYFNCFFTGLVILKCSFQMFMFIRSRFKLYVIQITFKFKMILCLVPMVLKILLQNIMTLQLRSKSIANYVLVSYFRSNSHLLPHILRWIILKTTKQTATQPNSKSKYFW